MKVERRARRALLLVFSLLHLAAYAQDNKPHIVFIYTDDMGLGDVSAYGPGAGVPTPNIDRIAKEGARFDQYYSASTMCSPSRAALLTGQFPSRHRLNNYLQSRAGNAQCEQDDFLNPAASRLPVALQHAGYKTFHIGKWHLGGGRDVDNAPSIGKYGFDEWVSTWESPDPHPDLGIKFPPWERQVEPNQVPREKRTAYMVDRSLDYLKRHKDQPCFINLWPDDMHTPHRASAEAREKHGADADEKKTPRKSFAAVLEEYDREIGRLLDGIKALGLEDNTIVVFSSDNGPEPPFDHTRTGGWRGMKLSNYEGGIRVPLLVRWPGKVPAGHVDKTSVISGVDLYLSLCALAGIEVPPAELAACDGEDKSHVLLGTPAKRQKILLWEYGRRARGQGYSYPHIPNDRSPNVAIRRGDYKLLVNDDGTSTELYNLLADPRETTNLAEKNPDLTADLKQRALEWRKSLPTRAHDLPTTTPIGR